MERQQIKCQQTYRTNNGLLLYVQDIDGQRVVYCHVGQIMRLESSLGRFAAMVDAEAPNQ